jgi:hypothetical protein
MILASILITDEEARAEALPPSVVENIESMKALHPGLEHHLFRGPELRDLIARDYGAQVLTAYDTLKPYAFKSDLARHCVMYKHGGLYADLSVYFLKCWMPGKLGVFRDFLYAAPWQVANTLYFAPPGHAAIAEAIALICENVKRRDHGLSFLCPTGPVSFGKAIALACEAADVVAGDSAWCKEKDCPGLISGRAHGFVVADQLVAVKRKRVGAPLDELGISGGNAYREMWQRREIYRDDLA